MAQARLFNLVSTTLAAAITASQTTLTLVDASAITLSGGDWCYLTLVDAASYNGSVFPPAQREIVKVTAVAGNVCTVVRAQDGTTAQQFAAGDVVECRLNKAAFDDISTLVSVPAAPTGTFALTIKGTSSNPTYGIFTNLCTYTKIGRLVLINGQMQIGTPVGGSGFAFLDGLPFAVSSALGERGGVVVTWNSFFAAGSVGDWLLPQPSTTTMQFNLKNTASALDNMDGAQPSMTALQAGVLLFHGFYYSAS
jgi:hypothetical protein